MVHEKIPPMSRPLAAEKIPSCPLTDLTFRFSVEYSCEPGQNVFLVGKSVPLGEWNPRKALLLTQNPSHSWELELHWCASWGDLEYKFVVMDDQCESVIWEPGNNRVLRVNKFGKDSVTEIICHWGQTIQESCDIHEDADAITENGHAHANLEHLHWSWCNKAHQWVKLTV
jgi:hypothetical protein